MSISVNLHTNQGRTLQANAGTASQHVWVSLEVGLDSVTVFLDDVAQVEGIVEAFNAAIDILRGPSFAQQEEDVEDVVGPCQLHVVGS